jgi:hypothetical protein
MNNELEWIWKEAVVDSFEVPSQNAHGGTENNHKTSVRVAGLQTKIWTGDLPDLKQEC